MKLGRLCIPEPYVGFRQPAEFPLEDAVVVGLSSVFAPPRRHRCCERRTGFGFGCEMLAYGLDAPMAQPGGGKSGEESVEPPRNPCCSGDGYNGPVAFDASQDDACAVFNGSQVGEWVREHFFAV